MLQPFTKYMGTLVRKPEQKQFLLAVSGGVDSVVMADLFYKAGYNFAIAHCNFSLRGKESDGDEAFVNKLAESYKAPFYCTHFNTATYAETHKVSIQMAARNLRYEWLKEVQQKHKYNYIVIAHHSDDALETFFINLLRGTGIAGLHGIASVHESLLRPLLGFNRTEIEAYAKAGKLKWREDSSNASDKYERNKIRHHLLPELLKISPDAPKAIKHTIENLRETEVVYREAIDEKLSKLLSEKDGKTHISIAGLKKLAHAHLYLYEYLKAYGFNYTQAKEICESFEGQAGKVFLSATHRLTKDRKILVLEKLEDRSKNTIWPLFTEDKVFTNGFIEMTAQVKDKPANYKPFHPPATACLDYDKLKFPLTTRKWAKGDKFYPLGMKSPKKVSDLLIDNKVSLSAKDDVFVLLSGNSIAWVIGHRIDDRFKIVPATKKMYICSIVKPE